MTRLTNDGDSSDEMNDDSSAASSTSSSSSSSSSSPESFQSKLKLIQHKSANKISELAENASDIIEKYSSPNSNHIIDDPLRTYDEIAAVTNEMVDAWKQYKTDIASVERERVINRKENESKFHEAYMNLVTEAFADELDDLRQGRIRGGSGGKKGKKQDVPDILKQDNIVMPGTANNENGNVDIEVLVKMLESGMEGWNAEEKELLLLELKGRNDDNDVDVDILTPHERRRRELFGGD